MRRTGGVKQKKNGFRLSLVDSAHKHVTALEKKVIAHMLEREMTEAGTKRKAYFIKANDGEKITVEIYDKEKTSRGLEWIKRTVQLGIKKTKNPSTTEINRCKKLIDDAKFEKPTITYYWKAENPHGKLSHAIKSVMNPAARTSVFVARIFGTTPDGSKKVLVSKQFVKKTNAQKWIDSMLGVKATAKNPRGTRKNFKNFTNTDFKKFQNTRLRQLTKNFQGAAHGKKIAVLQPDTAPEHKYILGHLVLLKVRTDGGKTHDIKFGGEAYLSADLRNNLWIVGKDAKFTDVNKPVKGTLKYLGKLIQVDYVTAKKHIENGETVRFWHPLGEVDKEFPTLWVDSDGFPIIQGGGYDIWNVGIVN